MESWIAMPSIHHADIHRPCGAEVQCQRRVFLHSRIDHEVVTEEKDIPATTVGNNRIPAGSIHYNGPPKSVWVSARKSAFQWDAMLRMKLHVATNSQTWQLQNVSVTTS